MTINKKIELPNKPDTKIDVSKVFNIDSDLTVKGFKDTSPWVPEVDESYVFDKFNCRYPVLRLCNVQINALAR